MIYSLNVTLCKNKHCIGLNKPEMAVYKILNKLYDIYSEIILIIPQYQLPIKLTYKVNWIINQSDL